MTRVRFLSRRAIAVAASALIGLVGALAIASPASAHHTSVEGQPECDTTTGEWVVTWTVRSHATPPEATEFKLVERIVEPAGTQLTGLPLDVFQNIDQPFVGEQRLPGDATSAKLSVRGKWNNGFEESRKRSKRIDFGGPCQKDQPQPHASFESACDGTVTVTLTNAEEATAAADFVVTGEADFQAEVTVAPGDSDMVQVPAKAAGAITVTVDGTVIEEGSWSEPEECRVEVPIASHSDCDTLTVEVTNPLEEQQLEATVTSGDVTEELTIEPGESAEVTFDAEEGTVATVTIGDESLEVAWEQPDDCEAPGEGGGDEDEGLPVTGMSTGFAVGAATLLVALGTGLFLVARRRRITFTA